MKSVLSGIKVVDISPVIAVPLPMFQSLVNIPRNVAWTWVCLGRNGQFEGPQNQTV